MREELQRWLDGEIGEADLPEELRPAARQWREWLDVGRESQDAPAWIEDAVMARIARRGRTHAWERAGRWLVDPWTVRVRPLAVAALAAAAIAIVLLWPGVRGGTADSSSVPGIGVAATPTRDDAVYVQFVYVAPGAASVAVAGDFNEWAAARAELRDPDGDGVWTAYVPVRPGLHKYMFVVDGKWVTDPRADRHVDDGFGHSNALMTILPPGSSI